MTVFDYLYDIGDKKSWAKLFDKILNLPLVYAKITEETIPCLRPVSILYIEKKKIRTQRIIELE